jgi:hypothetical protein
MIIVGGRTRSGGRPYRSTPGPDGFHEPCLAGLAGQGVTILEPTAGNGVAASGHGPIAGAARRLDMRS